MTAVAAELAPLGEGVEPSDAPSAPRSAGRVTRARLAHIDAMRPLKQLGVVSTHSVLAFAPATLWIGASITLLHVARVAFLFVSACMLTYGYQDLRWKGLGRFWRRRLVAVALPYLCWTLIYFLVGLHNEHGSPRTVALHLGYLTLTGYSQLYFLVVLIEFYLLFPLVAWLLRATRGHHVVLVVVSLVVQLAYLSAMHWSWLPSELRGTHGTRFFFSYEFYLLAGSVAAAHYDAFHAFVLRHIRAILVGTAITAAVGEATYWLGAKHLLGVLSFLGTPSDAFSPVMLPFNCFAIASIYLLGVALVRPGRSRLTERLVHLGVEDSYAIYLSQVLFLNAFVALGFRHLNSLMPWPLALGLGIALVYVCGVVVGEVLGHTRLARPMAGRSQATRQERTISSQNLPRVLNESPVASQH